jgi:rhodanese-related sulfurtransferase
MDPSPTPGASSCTARELAERLKRGDDLVLLDVREASELAVARFPAAQHLALATLPLRLADVPRDRTVVVACHHGGRSARAQQFLRAQGYMNVINLEGGIDAWSRDVDPAVARY